MGLMKGSVAALSAGRKAAETRKLKLNCVETHNAFNKSYNTEGKNKFRNELIDKMQRYDITDGNIASLETSQWLFNKSISAHHIHYQSNFEEYSKMLKTKPKNTDIIYGNIRELVKSTIPIDGLWLDYMQMYDTVENDILDIVRCDAMQNCSVIGLTVSTRSPSKNRSRQLQVERIIMSINDIFKDYERSPIISYSSPAVMYNVIFVRYEILSQLKEEAERVFSMICGDECYYGEYTQYNRHRYNQQIVDILHAFEEPCYFEKARDPSLLETPVTRKPVINDDRWNSITWKFYEEFVKKYLGILIEPAEKDADRCLSCGQPIGLRHKKYILKKDIDILKMFGWKILK